MLMLLQQIQGYDHGGFYGLYVSHLASRAKRDIHVEMMRLTLNIVGKTLFTTEVARRRAAIGAAGIFWFRFAQQP